MNPLRRLANENVPLAVVQALRAQGIDVAWIMEDMCGATDAAILDRAEREERTLATLDKDFGEMAVRAPAAARWGVVLIRLRGAAPEIDNARMVSALVSGHSWAGHFSVIEDDRIRMRPLR